MARTVIAVDGCSMVPADVAAVVREGVGVRLDPAARDRIEAANRAAAQAVAWRPVYGATTGVGANRDIPADRVGHGLRILESHATTAGEALPDDVARAVLVVRANQLAAGGSGVRPEVVEGLLAAIGSGAVPLMHRYTGLGTGDLSALAELGLALSGVVPWRAGTAPVTELLDADVLPLLSSPAVTVAEATLAAVDLADLLAATYPVVALTFLALRGNAEAFDPRVHEARPQAGQAAAAAAVRELLDGCRYPAPVRIQDPFGLRAFPQVHGSARTALQALHDVLAVELNARVENPLVVETEAGGDVLHHGNWHGAPLSLALDTGRLAVHATAALSAARTASLLDPDVSGLPAFLATGPQASSGAMGLEYVAHAALARLRTLAHPASLGTATLSRGAEDHASFATEAARLAGDCVPPLRTLLACELVTAVRALRIAGLRPGDLAPAPLAEVYAELDDALPADLADRALTADLAIAEGLLRGQPGTRVPAFGSSSGRSSSA